jgi:hypothetical protein
MFLGLTRFMSSGAGQLMLICSRLGRYSPLSFTNSSLEEDFLRVQKSHGTRLACANLWAIVAVASLLFCFNLRLDRGRALALSYPGGVALLALAFRAAFPKTFANHVQVRSFQLCDLAFQKDGQPTNNTRAEPTSQGPHSKGF